MSVQVEVLATVQRLCSERGGWSFAAGEVVRALPHLNPSTIRTHVGSRCCVNAPANHAHRWGYFRRTRRGEYELLPKYRPPTGTARRHRPSGLDVEVRPGGTSVTTRVRDTVHAVIIKDGEWYVADCAEIAVVTQGRTLDETVSNLREAISLHLEGEEATSLGIARSPRLVATLELRPADAAA
jgi:predicted RNase H-like HicB family nuclease